MARVEKEDNVHQPEDHLHVKLESEVVSQASSHNDNWHHKLLLRFAKFMVKYPYVNIIIVLLIFIWTAVIGFVPKLGAQKLPSFAEPTKGFLPRDTVLSNREMSYNNLLAYYTKGNLADRPFQSVSPRSKRSTKSVISIPNICSQYRSIAYDVEPNKIIYEHKSGGNLMAVDRLKDICKLHQRVMTSNANYGFYVQKDTGTGNNCPSNSIPTYISLLNNRTSCSQITAADVTKFVSVVKLCTAVYKTGQLQNCVASSSQCVLLPYPCNSSNVAGMVYNSLFYLSDKNFVNNPDVLKLALVSDSYDNAYSDGIINNLYKSVYKAKLKDLSSLVENDVKLVAYDFFNLKFKLFNSQLFVEITLILVAIVLVFVFIMIYSGSVFIGLMTFLCVLVAAVMAYFFYGIVFRLPFFPFLNVLTFIFLVGIGADDAFVFMGAWKEAKKLMPRGKDRTLDESLVQWMTYSMKHAVVAMFVTSFTTAAAFYANATSKIIAIKCFGIYAGTCILLNYVLMVFWFPVAVVITEKYLHPCVTRISSKCSRSSVVAKDTTLAKRENFFTRFSSRMQAISRKVFEEILPKLIMKLRFVFLFIFTCLGIGGVIAVYVSPKLRLPITSDFQMFSSRDSLEQYALGYKSKFSFANKGSSFNMSLRFVFGVKSDNTANMMNPDDKGYLQLKPSFSIASQTEQIWLKNFCTNLKNTTFIDTNSQGTCTSLLLLWKQMAESCSTPYLPAPCCNRTAPVSPQDFYNCSQTFTAYRGSSFSSLLYDKQNKARAMVIQESSNSPYTEAYDKSDKIFNQVETWMKNQMRNAPPSFSGGWFLTELTFYNLQKSLASGTPVSLGISVAIAFGVVLFTTGNVLISIYSIVCIIFVIGVSTGMLVLAGWRLNILESIIFAVAAGLSVDFTLHYGVAYRTAINKATQESRIRYALVHLGSAVTMGAVTTFISGLVMAPASVLVYIQASHFLMTLMTFSWLYATFFFLPLCAVIGPTGNFGQISLSGLCSGKKEKEQYEIETNQNAVDGGMELNRMTPQKT